MSALAPVLLTTPEYLAFGVGSGDSSGVPVIGEVAAGLWLEIDGNIDEGKFEDIFLPNDQRFPKDAQYGLMVRGTSVNRVAQPNDFLHCVDLGITAIQVENDDLVIVERRRAQAGQKEVTAKRVRRRGKIIELMPDSDDEKWRESVQFDPATASDDDEEVIFIVALAIGVYKPLRRSTR